MKHNYSLFLININKHFFYINKHSKKGHLLNLFHLSNAMEAGKVHFAKTKENKIQNRLKSPAWFPVSTFGFISNSHILYAHYVTNQSRRRITVCYWTQFGDVMANFLFFLFFFFCRKS